MAEQRQRPVLKLKLKLGGLRLLKASGPPVADEVLSSDLWQTQQLLGYAPRGSTPSEIVAKLRTLNKHLAPVAAWIDFAAPPSFPTAAVLTGPVKNPSCSALKPEKADRCSPGVLASPFPALIPATASGLDGQGTSLERFRKSIKLDESSKPNSAQPLHTSSLPAPSLTESLETSEHPTPATSNPLRRFLPTLKRPAESISPDSETEPVSPWVKRAADASLPVAKDTEPAALPTAQHPKDSCLLQPERGHHAEGATPMDTTTSHVPARAVMLLHQESCSDQGTDSLLYMPGSDDHTLHHSGGSSEPPGCNLGSATAHGARGPAHALHAPHPQQSNSSVPPCSQHPLLAPDAPNTFPPTTSHPPPHAHPDASAQAPEQLSEQQQQQLSSTYTQDSAAIAPAATSPTAPTSSQSGTCHVSTGAGEYPVMGPSFLNPPKLTAAAQSFSTISPFDMLMAHSVVRPASPALIEELMRRAKATKHRADEAKGKAQWKMNSLSKQLESSLQFMEACEMMTRMPRSREQSSRIESLYGQTAELLHHTVKNIETMHASELGKEALRILCERLCAVCCMRQASHAPNKYEDLARRIGSIIKEHGSQLTAAAAGAAQGAPQQQSQQQQQQQPQPRGAPAVAPTHVSPDDSSHSSRDIAAPATAGTSASTPPLSAVQLQLPDLGQLQIKLLAAAKQVSRYAELIRRSTNSFQVFIERKAVQESQGAKLACMHMAVVCLDMGMMNGMTLINHATEAMHHIKVL